VLDSASCAALHTNRISNSMKMTGNREVGAVSGFAQKSAYIRVSD
jgi:hypothetical protein